MGQLTLLTSPGCVAVPPYVPWLRSYAPGRGPPQTLIKGRTLRVRSTECCGTRH